MIVGGFVTGLYHGPRLAVNWATHNWRHPLFGGVGRLIGGFVGFVAGLVYGSIAGPCWQAYIGLCAAINGVWKDQRNLKTNTQTADGWKMLKKWNC